jgi:UDP-glucose 4-epimerase
MSLAIFSAFYSGKRVVVTGGLGFIGSNLALQLAGLNARVTVIDASLPGCGANPRNLEDASAGLRVVAADVGEAERVRAALEGADVVFNLAGEISHIHSMLFPERDLQINTVAQLRFLDAVARYAPGVRVVYASTRQVYGSPRHLPVDEHHTVEPADYNGVHKLAACQYHTLLTRLGRIDAIVLRLSNVYGPRMALSIPCQGFLSVFTARAMLGLPIAVFGSGEQLRDPIYVDDACEAFLRAGMTPHPAARVINVGSPEVHSVREIAAAFSEMAGLPAPETRPFPPELKAIDIGDYYTCNSTCQNVLGWVPSIPFRAGLDRTLAFYAGRRPHYLPENGQGRCPLHP